MTDPSRRAVLRTTGGLLVAGGLAGCGGAGDADGTEPTGTDEPGEGTPTEGGTEVGGDNENGEQSAYFRVAHASPGAPNVDLYFDGERTLRDAAFGDVTDYYEMPVGDRVVRIATAEAGDETLFEQELSLSGAHTALLFGEYGPEAERDFEVRTLDDDLSVPGEESALVRGIHASPDAPSVDLFDAETDELLFEGLAYGDVETREVPAGQYRVRVRPSDGSGEADGTAESNNEPDGNASNETDGGDGGSGEGAARADDDVEGRSLTYEVTLEPRSTYTAIALGYLRTEGSRDEPFDLLVVRDAVEGQPVTEGSAAGGSGDEGTEADGTENGGGDGDGRDGGDGGY